MQFLHIFYKITYYFQTIFQLQLAHKAAELFKNLSEARKLKYATIAEQEKKEYLIKLEKFA